MISITRFLKDRSSESEAVLRRTLGLLFQLIEIHAIEGDAVDYAQFRSGVHEIASRFTGDTPSEEILIIGGEIATLLREYAERTTRFVKAQNAEYQRMLSAFTETIAATGRASEHTVQRLRDVERKLEKAYVIEDIRLLRMQLDECLESIREEIQAQQLHVTGFSRCVEDSCTQTQLNVEDLQAIPASVVPADPITGLPGRAAAETALASACAVKRGAYWVAVVVVDRIASINSRFGYAVGDKVLRKVAQQLQSGLSAEDQIFRWNGPAFMALLLRTEPESEIRKELTRIAGIQADEVIEIGYRSVLLPVSSNWMLLPLNAPVRVMRESIDQFVASQSSGY